MTGLRYSEKFEDDNGKVRDTGKIIYASMFVNGEEKNLYNFNFKNDEEYYDIKGRYYEITYEDSKWICLSSSFGMRNINIHNMHRGTDFAAPREHQ